MAHMRTAQALDPYNDVIQRMYMINLFFLEQCDELISLCKRREENGFSEKKNLWGCYFLQGKFDQAYEIELERVLVLNDLELKQALKAGYESGGYEEAMKREAEIIENRAKDSNLPLFVIINRYAMARQKEKCLELLEKGFVEHDPKIPYITIIPLFDFLRNEPGFQSILQAMNLPE